jgi:hypothetical protein
MILELFAFRLTDKHGGANRFTLLLLIANALRNEHKESEYQKKNTTLKARQGGNEVASPFCLLLARNP